MNADILDHDELHLFYRISGLMFRDRDVSVIAIAIVFSLFLGGCAVTSEDKSTNLSTPPGATSPQAASAPIDVPKSTAVFPREPSVSPMPAPAPSVTYSSSAADVDIQSRSPVHRRYVMASQAGSSNEIEKLESYSVVVSADKEIRIPGPPGEMRVWIGSPPHQPMTPAGMHSGTTVIPALSNTARITPFAPGMEVVPKESVCERIDPTGSEVRFQLKPATKGTYKVGADVALYVSSDCSGLPIPKATSTIQVEVSVNTMAKIEQHGDEIAAETWKGFLAFWGKVVAFIFALLLFLIRKRLFQWFGFKPKD